MVNVITITFYEIKLETIVQNYCLYFDFIKTWLTILLENNKV